MNEHRRIINLLRAIYKQNARKRFKYETFFPDEEVSGFMLETDEEVNTRLEVELDDIERRGARSESHGREAREEGH